jgi:hypothetical protein
MPGIPGHVFLELRPAGWKYLVVVSHVPVLSRGERGVEQEELV